MQKDIKLILREKIREIVDEYVTNDLLLLIDGIDTLQTQIYLLDFTVGKINFLAYVNSCILAITSASEFRFVSKTIRNT